jgi:dihydrofolate reductase
MNKNRAIFHAVAAMAENRIIGRAGQLPWHLPGDLQFFKKLTSGHPVLMGRKTYESIGRPLPKRRNLVLTRQNLTIPGLECLNSLEALTSLDLDGPVFVIGGGEIYQWLLPHCQSVYLTQVHRTVEGDAFFPPFEADFAEPIVLEKNEDYTIKHYLRH